MNYPPHKSLTPSQSCSTGVPACYSSGGNPDLHGWYSHRKLATEIHERVTDYSLRQRRIVCAEERADEVGEIFVVARGK